MNKCLPIAVILLSSAFSASSAHALKFAPVAAKLPVQQVAAQDAVTMGGPFTLTTQAGKTVTDADFKGKYLLVYFGYTFCPDMCPTGLQSIAHAMDQLGPTAEKVQPLFITIDPARDTEEKLREYTASFNPKILGLRGTDEQTASVAKEYQVVYKKQESEDGPDQYMMDHTSLIYLMDPNGKFIAIYPEQVDPATLVKAIRTASGDKSPVPAPKIPAKTHK